MTTSSTIYFIDDEPEVLKILCDTARVYGFEVAGYSSAREFFQRVRSFSEGSIVVLDLKMPDMDGIEVMRRLVKEPTPPALILISGHDQSVLHSAFKLGQAHSLSILGYFQKPFDFKALHGMFRKHRRNYENSNLHVSASLPADSGAKVTIDEIISGIDNNQFVLHYQPKVSLTTRRVSGYESLLRWQHPIKGLLYPNAFIPLAEHEGVIGRLTHWVIDAAVRQEARWHKLGVNAPIAVNISAKDITSLTLPEQLESLLQSRKLKTGHLILEITESALMGELTTCLDILTRMRLKGIQLAIDDFGTGYSSLSMLHRVPFTELKIDRSFVSEVTTDDEANAIVKTCVTLADSLKMLSVAEGIETKDQLAMLSSVACDMGQGYLFSRPCPPQELTVNDEYGYQG